MRTHDVGACPCVHVQTTRKGGGRHRSIVSHAHLDLLIGAARGEEPRGWVEVHGEDGVLFFVLEDEGKCRRQKKRERERVVYCVYVRAKDMLLALEMSCVWSRRTFPCQSTWIVLHFIVVTLRPMRVEDAGPACFLFIYFESFQKKKQVRPTGEKEMVGVKKK